MCRVLRLSVTLAPCSAPPPPQQKKKLNKNPQTSGRCHSSFLFMYNTCCESSSLPSSLLRRRPCATCNRHAFPTVLAHAGWHRGEHAPPHCGEPDEDHGCVSGRVSGLLKRKKHNSGDMNWTGTTAEFYQRLAFAGLSLVSCGGWVGGILLNVKWSFK